MKFNLGSIKSFKNEDDRIRAQAEYWVKYYNAKKDRTPEYIEKHIQEYIDKYKRYVKNQK